MMLGHYIIIASIILLLLKAEAKAISSNASITNIASPQPPTSKVDLPAVYPAHRPLPNSQIDHFIIAFTWPLNFCRTSPCRPSPPPTFFTIHGLWPSWGNRQLINCNLRNQLDTRLFSSHLRSEMRTYWPGFTMSDYAFWNHEWTKHGTCTPFRQQQYFDLALQRLRNVDILNNLKQMGINPGATGLTVNQVRSAFNRGEEPYVHCTNIQRRTFLVELRFCLDQYASTFRDCGAYFPRVSNCAKPFDF